MVVGADGSTSEREADGGGDDARLGFEDDVLKVWLDSRGTPNDSEREGEAFGSADEVFNAGASSIGTFLVGGVDVVEGEGMVERDKRY